MPIYRGGRAIYGEAIGILLNKTVTPLLPGNVGNASTYDFPVRIENIDAFPCDWWCDEEGASKRRLTEFIKAAKELEHKGVRAITTGCGYFAVFQEEASRALSRPLFTSPLLEHNPDLTNNLTIHNPSFKRAVDNATVGISVSFCKVTSLIVEEVFTIPSGSLGPNCLIEAV